MAKNKKDKKGRLLRSGERQRADGRYEYRYEDSSGETRSIYSWKLVETDRVPKGKHNCVSLRELEKKIFKDVDDGINEYLAQRLPLNNYFDDYIKTKRELKSSTLVNYKYMYDHYVRDNFGMKPIGSIKYSDVKKFYNHLIDDIGFKPNSMEIINTIIHPIFSAAVKDNIIRLNPATGVMAEIKKSHDWSKGKRHPLTEEEQTAFVNYISESRRYMHWLPLFTVILGTGCRIAEVVGLRWCDCDFEDGFININHNLVYRQQENGKCEFHITTPKTEAGNRDIPMLTEVRNALCAEKKRQQEAGGLNTTEIDGYTGFIFQNRYGYVLSPHCVNRAIERICRDYNSQESEMAAKENREPILLPHFTCHHLRHTFCTRFCENETNLKVIQEIMGHADITTTMDIYNEATKKKKRESFENLDGKIRIS